LSGFEAANHDSVRAEAHKLKSSARTVGAHELADLCLDLEEAGTAKDAMLLQTLLGRLQSICGRTKDAIARALVA
jgi:HPt (histidine-containing phosphotransfer) domain-containing protein